MQTTLPLHPATPVGSKAREAAELSEAALSHVRRPTVRQATLRKLHGLLAIPTVSAEPRHHRDIEAAAKWLGR